MKAVICQVIAECGDWTIHGEAGLMCFPDQDDWAHAMSRLLTVAVTALNQRVRGLKYEVGIYTETLELRKGTPESAIVQDTVVLPSRTPLFKWRLSLTNQERK